MPKCQTDARGPIVTTLGFLSRVELGLCLRGRQQALSVSMCCLLCEVDYESIAILFYLPLLSLAGNTSVVW